MGSPQERLTIHFSGKVQGVGFRWRTCTAVEGLAVRGYVMNLPDGRVELVLEGSGDDLAVALSRVRGSLGGLITHESIVTSCATGTFTRFEIRR